jgi:uncharacterized membrane protein
MEPFITLLLVAGTVLAVAAIRGRGPRAAWPLALRAGLSAMFVLTGTAHFVGLRGDLIEMVPDVLPAPGLLVTVTGVLELAGAAGLWVRTLRPWVAAGLGALLIVMFPANVHHALTAPQLDVGEQLLPRTVLQLVFLAVVGLVLRHELLQRRYPKTLPMGVVERA